MTLAQHWLDVDTKQKWVNTERTEDRKNGRGEKSFIIERREKNIIKNEKIFDLCFFIAVLASYLYTPLGLRWPNIGPIWIV